jgi:outer membrane receptor for ferric coprogen and ferric-rhodotorulic acid
MRSSLRSPWIRANVLAVVVLALLTFGLVVITQPRASAGVRMLDVSIEAGSAAVSLAELIRQTGLQVLFEADAVRGHTTQAVRGKLDATEALRRMLAGSGLIFEFINERTVAVRVDALAQTTRDPRPGPPFPVRQL